MHFELPPLPVKSCPYGTPLSVTVGVRELILVGLLTTSLIELASSPDKELPLWPSSLGDECI